MSFLIDTDIASVYMNRPSALTHRFLQHAGRLFIPSVVLAELRAGAYLRPNPAPLLRKIVDFLAEVEVLDFDVACADQFGRLRGVLKGSGFTVASIDLMIATTSLVHDLTLVTHNTAHFARIPDLRLADWLAP